MLEEGVHSFRFPQREFNVYPLLEASTLQTNLQLKNSNARRETLKKSVKTHTDTHTHTHQGNIAKNVYFKTTNDNMNKTLKPMRQT